MIFSTDLQEAHNSITDGTIWKALLSFFFPILAGSLFQQLYNTVDAIVVGRFVGKEALAAVGGGTAVYVNLLVGFFVGLSSGAGVIISQFYGAKKEREVSRSVQTALILAAAGGLAMTVLGVITSAWILKITGTPIEIFSQSLTYLRIFFTGMIPMFVYNMGSGILRAIGDSRRPLYILIVGCITNIAGDLILVPIAGFGVAGAAWATVISETVCMIMILVILTKSQASYRFEPKALVITPHIFRNIIRVGLPAGLQSTMYGLSNIIIQTSINSFGTNSIAAWAAYGKIDAVFWMMINAFGIAVTTFSGQNFGAGRYDRIHKSMWQSLVIASGLTVICCILFWFSGNMIFQLFTTDTAVISDGMKILHFLVPVWILYISIEILSGAIRGTGDSFIPMIITLIGVCVLRIIWIITAVPHHRDIVTVLASYPITWTITSIFFWLYYISGRWLRQKR
jgi:putative MATE family efflux protein